MLDYDPVKERQLNEIQAKAKMVLSEDELRIEQALLREKLKAVNKNLDRIVSKELVT